MATGDPVTRESDGKVERNWTRIGVAFACAPAKKTPDLERLLLATAGACEHNSRLVPLTVTWLARYGDFVARHRLKRLVQTVLDVQYQAALGLILEETVAHGAPRDLLSAAEVCSPADPERPLFSVDQGRLADLAKRHASPLALRWGLWAPEVVLKPEAIRPAWWILRQNPGYRDRIIRKGDLRVSILESLRHDTPDGAARSESELARLAGANRSAVRKALAALVLEGAVAIDAGGRDHPVRLLAA